MRLDGHKQIECPLPAQGPFPKGAGPHEADRPAVSGHAFRRVPADEGLAASAGPPGKPEAGPASDAGHGATGHLPAAPDQSARTWAQGLPLSAGRHGYHQAQPGVGGGYHLHPHVPGFLYLVAIMDWYSRYVVGWRRSNTLDADFCVEVLEEALVKGKPEVFNTDQGSQFTSEGFTGILEQHGVRISMDGKGRYTDNIFVERLWRTVKYEEVYLKAYSDGREAKDGLGAYFHFYNTQRPHQALGYRAPAKVFHGDSVQPVVQSIERRWPPSGAWVNLGKTAGLSLNVAPNLSN